MYVLTDMIYIYMFFTCSYDIKCLVVNCDCTKGMTIKTNRKNDSLRFPHNNVNKRLVKGKMQAQILNSEVKSLITHSKLNLKIDNIITFT